MASEISGKRRQLKLSKKPGVRSQNYKAVIDDITDDDTDDFDFNEPEEEEEHEGEEDENSGSQSLGWDVFTSAAADVAFRNIVDRALTDEQLIGLFENLKERPPRESNTKLNPQVENLRLFRSLDQQAIQAKSGAYFKVLTEFATLVPERQKVLKTEEELDFEYREKEREDEVWKTRFKDEEKTVVKKKMPTVIIVFIGVACGIALILIISLAAYFAG